MQVIDSKIKEFYKKSKPVKRLRVRRRLVVIKYDSVSKMHLFTRSVILKSYKAAGAISPRIVHSSLPKIMSKFYTKRSVLSKVRNSME